MKKYRFPTSNKEVNIDNRSKTKNKYKISDDENMNDRNTKTIKNVSSKIKAEKPTEMAANVTDVCFDFQNRGVCQRGNRCRFKHVPAHQSLCLDWKQGKCPRGSQCRFAHRYGKDIIEPSPKVKAKKKAKSPPKQIIIRSFVHGIQ